MKDICIHDFSESCSPSCDACFDTLLVLSGWVDLRNQNFYTEIMGIVT